MIFSICRGVKVDGVPPPKWTVAIAALGLYRSILLSISRMSRKLRCLSHT
jgi:hypothetical protein